jgi:hypothetical protein
MYGNVVCCCCCAPDDWEFTQTGFAGGPPWEELGDWFVAIYFENSANCSGSNSNVQSGTAKKCLVVETDSESGEVEYKVTLTGHIEKQNPGFEHISVKFIRCDDNTTFITVTDQSDKTGWRLHNGGSKQD